MCNVGQNWNHRSRSKESENISKFQQFNYQNCPCDLTKKINNHTLCFCSLIRKLKAFENLKWAQLNLRRQQGTSTFTRKLQLLIFSRLWDTFFLFSCLWNILFFQIYIVFNHYFSCISFSVYRIIIYHTPLHHCCQYSLLFHHNVV